MTKYNSNAFLHSSRNRGGTIEKPDETLYNMRMEKVKLLSVEETSEVLGISRTGIYKLINSKELPAIKLRSRTMIKMIDLKNFIDTREEYVGCQNEI